MEKTEVRKRENGAVLLVHPDFSERVNSDWFRPEFWGNRAQPVGSGGRGGAWFLDADGDRMVLRAYRRGGLIAKLSSNAYTYTREKQVRSFAEFRLLNQLVTMGLPVPRAIAAWYQKLSPVQYQAAIIVERLDDAVPLADIMADMSTDQWHALGRLIRRFHDAGVRHADLNCFNVLVAAGEFHLIDFDKGQIMPHGTSSRWKKANLDRFARSLRKVAGDSFQQKVWKAFTHGYQGRPVA
ncbi:3-deoxy-D-manno-octulosonic acid kinase [Marinobacter salinisoli]|uniref:3-deoxy-D-manno-octulosonic acid kinase n=1 Tax=Marinobacter salinisoli TaxID=2769486 RepID=A0ABX7MUN0_9GAMM|nr:3-deoxy-D-manno-octulosonic acid kinase [Marinobacter salinisoli]QSP96051.1 3-deoxy-D-manno-octulosonic acid kinase [Marinobacter salinisoli]